MPEIDGVSYPNPDKLDELSAEWGRAADKLDVLGNQIATVQMGLAWTGLAAGYFVEVTSQVWKQVTEVAGVARSISGDIKEYANQVREMIAQAIKAGLITLISTFLGFAAFWIPGLGALMGRLIQGLTKLLTTVGNLMAKVVPTSVRALVAPFVSPKVIAEVVASGAVGATTEVAISFIAEFTASGVTDTDVHIDPMTFGLAAGVGFAGGGLFALVATNSRFRGGGFLERHPFPFTRTSKPKVSSSGAPRTSFGSTGKGQPKVIDSIDPGEVGAPTTAVTPPSGKGDPGSGIEGGSGISPTGLPHAGIPGGGKSSANGQAKSGAGQRAVPESGRFTDPPEAGVGPNGGARLSVDGSGPILPAPARLDNGPPVNGSGGPLTRNPPGGAEGRQNIDVNRQSVNEPPLRGQNAPPVASADGGRVHAGGGPRQPGGTEGFEPAASWAKAGQDGVIDGITVPPRAQAETVRPQLDGPGTPSQRARFLGPDEVVPGRVGEGPLVTGRGGDGPLVTGRVGDGPLVTGRVDEVVPVNRGGEVSVVPGRVGESLVSGRPNEGSPSVSGRGGDGPAERVFGAEEAGSPAVGRRETADGAGATPVDAPPVRADAQVSQAGSAAPRGDAAPAVARDGGLVGAREAGTSPVVGRREVGGSEGVAARADGVSAVAGRGEAKGGQGERSAVGSAGDRPASLDAASGVSGARSRSDSSLSHRSSAVAEGNATTPSRQGAPEASAAPSPTQTGRQASDSPAPSASGSPGERTASPQSDPTPDAAPGTPTSERAGSQPATEKSPGQRLQRRQGQPEGMHPDREGPAWRRNREAYEQRAREEAGNLAEFRKREQQKTHALGEMKQRMNETGGMPLERFRSEYTAWQERTGKSYTPEQLARAEEGFAKQAAHLWQTKFTHAERVRGGRYDIFYRNWPPEVARLARNFRFDFYADLHVAQTRAGQAFDDARLNIERAQPGSGRTAEDFAEARAQYVDLVTKTYRINYQADRAARADGSYETWKPQVDRSFASWQKQLENGLPARFDKEVELDTFMKSQFSQRLGQWKQSRGLADGRLPWEEKVAEEFRLEQRPLLTDGPSPYQRSSASTDQPGGGERWQDVAVDALPGRFDRAQEVLTRRLADERELESFHALEDGSPFDRVLADLPEAQAAVLNKDAIARERTAFLTRSREAYFDALTGGNPDEAVPKWQEGRAQAEKVAADNLALEVQRNQLMADLRQRRIDQAQDPTLPADGMVRVREAFQSDLERAYQDVWGEHPGAFAKGPGDESLKEVWSRWAFRTEDLNGRLDVHMLHEERLRNVLDIAARDFESVFGLDDPPILPGLESMNPKARYKIPYEERVAIADEFRRQYVSNYHEKLGRPNESVDGWLAHEKMLTNQFERTTEWLRVLRERDSAAGGDSGADALAADRPNRVSKTRHGKLGDVSWEHKGDYVVWHEPWGESAFRRNVIVRRTTSDGNELTEFDGRGRPTAGVGPDGQRFTIRYSWPESRSGVIHYRDDSVLFTLDDSKRLTAGMDAGGRKFTVTYDDKRGVAHREYYDGSVEEMKAPDIRYDPKALARLVDSVDLPEVSPVLDKSPEGGGGGRVSDEVLAADRYVYDSSGRVAGIRNGKLGDVSWEHEGDYVVWHEPWGESAFRRNVIVRRTTSDGNELTEFDGRGRPTAGVGPDGQRFTIRYSWSEGRSGEIHYGDDSVLFTLDDSKRLTAGMDADNREFTVTYDDKRGVAHRKYDDDGSVKEMKAPDIRYDPKAFAEGSFSGLAERPLVRAEGVSAPEASSSAGGISGGVVGSRPDVSAQVGGDVPAVVPEGGPVGGGSRRGPSASTGTGSGADVAGEVPPVRDGADVVLPWRDDPASGVDTGGRTNGRTGTATLVAERPPVDDVVARMFGARPPADDVVARMVAAAQGQGVDSPELSPAAAVRGAESDGGARASHDVLAADRVESDSSGRVAGIRNGKLGDVSWEHEGDYVVWHEPWGESAFRRNVIVRRTTSDGNELTEFDGRGRPTAGVGPDGQRFTIRYSWSEGRSGEIHYGDDSVLFTLDDSKRLTAGMDADNREFTVTYDDKRGVAHRKYDDDGSVKEMKAPDIRYDPKAFAEGSFSGLAERPLVRAEGVSAPEASSSAGGPSGGVVGSRPDVSAQAGRHAPTVTPEGGPVGGGSRRGPSASTGTGSGADVAGEVPPVRDGADVVGEVPPVRDGADVVLPWRDDPASGVDTGGRTNGRTGTATLVAERPPADDVVAQLVAAARGQGEVSPVAAVRGAESDGGARASHDVLAADRYVYDSSGRIARTRHENLGDTVWEHHGDNFTWDGPWGKFAIRADAMATSGNSAGVALVLRTTADGNALTEFDNVGRPTRGVGPDGRRFDIRYGTAGGRAGEITYQNGYALFTLDHFGRLTAGVNAGGQSFTVVYDDKRGVAHRHYFNGSVEEMTAPPIRLDPKVVFAERPLTGNAMADLLFSQAWAEGSIRPTAPPSADVRAGGPLSDEAADLAGAPTGTRGGQSSSPATGRGPEAAAQVPPVRDGSVIPPSRLDGPVVGADTSGRTGSRDVIAEGPPVDAQRNTSRRPVSGVVAPQVSLRSPLATVGASPRSHAPVVAPASPRVPALAPPVPHLPAVASPVPHLPSSASPAPPLPSSASPAPHVLTDVERGGGDAVRRMLASGPPPVAVLPPASGPGHLAHPPSGPAPAPLPRPLRPMRRTGPDYFAGPLDGLAATASGRAVLLHEGPAPTLPAADRPRGSRAGLTVALDLDGQRLAQVPEALRRLRPEFQSGLTLQFAGRWPSLSPERAESMANELLRKLNPTAALQVPAGELVGRPAPTPWVVPVDQRGNATFTAMATAFRFHAGNAVHAGDDFRPGDAAPASRIRNPYGLPSGPWPGTYELALGWYIDARDPDRLWVGRHLPETVVPRRGGAAGPETAAPRRGGAAGPVPIVVGNAGEVVPDEVLAQLDRIRVASAPTEIVLVGQTLTDGQRQQLAQVRAALPDGWQAHPVPAGWVVAAAGAVPADPGVAATRTSYPGARVLFVDPAGVDAAAVARSVVGLVAALPSPLRDRVVVQPVPGAAVPWQALAELSAMLPGRATGVPALVVPVARLAETPPASARGFVPMTWSPSGPVRTLPHFADHYRVYGPGATPREPLPAGLAAGDGHGRFAIDLPGLLGWVVDTTYPGMVHIRPGGVELPPPPFAATTARPDAVRVRVSGAPTQSQRAGIFTVLEGLRAGRPLDVALADEPDGLRALENAAVRESLPPGFTAHQLPAGHLVARGTERPAELDGARDIPPAADVTLIQLGAGVPVGVILGSLPSGVRDRAVLRRSDDPPLPPAWVPLYLRRRQWPAERVGDRGERSRLIDNERLTALQTATTRTWVEQAVGQATVAPVVAASSKALRLANLGHQELAEHHLAALHVESDTDQLTSLLRGAGFALPPPVSLGGGAGANQSQHANAAMLEAIRLFLSDRPDRAYEVILRNRSALVGRQRIDWVRWLGELRDALPDRREGIGTLADHVMTC
ncbi:hypothetical protein [Micromonospora sp. CA-111912]|uniref:WXG100-like domain-containing protein n=1 Tax=Micromonospora sp. CA-111912 TaxID=3239955 RepID=UPI003D8E5E18